MGDVSINAHGVDTLGKIGMDKYKDPKGDFEIKSGMIKMLQDIVYTGVEDAMRIFETSFHYAKHLVLVKKMHKSSRCGCSLSHSLESPFNGSINFLKNPLQHGMHWW